MEEENQKEELVINGERVFLTKSKLFGWGVTYPPKIDGKIVWKHLIAGRTWWNLLVPVIFVAIALGVTFEYLDAINIANDCLAQTDLLGNLIR